MPWSPVPGLLMMGTLVLATSLDQWAERNQKYAQGLAYSRAAGKPFLVVGRPKGNHGCGDICLDLDSRVAQECPVALVDDVRSIPLPTGHVGAAFVSHVLEHLPSVEDAILAWGELQRVADLVLVAGPSPLSLIARLVPDHCLWAWQLPDGSLYLQHREIWNPSMPNSWIHDHPLREAVVGADLQLKAAVTRVA